MVEHVFGSGEVVSTKAYETVVIGNADDDAPSSHSSPIDDMEFWEIQEHGIEAWTSGASFSAIVGLGPRDKVPSLEKGEKRSETLLEKANIQTFSICLQREAPSLQSAASATAANAMVADGKSAKAATPGGLLGVAGKTDGAQAEHVSLQSAEKHKKVTTKQGAEAVAEMQNDSGSPGW